jgi:FkbM family methyltransferase
MALSIARHPMSRGHRLAAVQRLFFWQLWRRIPYAGAEVTLPGGSTFWCPAWSHLASACVSSGFHEEELLFVRDALREGEANVELNSPPRKTTVLDVALGDCEGRARLSVDLDAGNHLVPSDTNGTDICVRPLDVVLSELGTTPTIVKIDVERHDETVLRGALRMLEKDRPTLIVEIWAGGNAIRTLLAGFEYRFFSYKRDLRRRVEFQNSFAGDSESGRDPSVPRSRGHDQDREPFTS